MAKENLLFDYTVLDAAYTHGKLQFITGADGAPAANLDSPADTRIDDIKPYTGGDPVVFSYMNGSAPRVLLCNVTTNFTTGTSTGTYSVCVPTSAPDPQNPGSFIWTWAITGYQDLQLVDENNNPVLGNPYGVVQVGNFLYLVEYDSANIYTLDLTALESASGPTYTVTAANIHDASDDFVTTPPPADPHGASILTLTDKSDPDKPVTYLYALFGVGGYPAGYSASALVRYEVISTGALSVSTATEVGANAMALVPAPNNASPLPTGQDAMVVLVPAIGGIQQGAVTNGIASNLSVAQAFTNFPDGETAPVAFTGDPIPSPAIFPQGNYDIKGVAVSDDGNNAYLLTATYSAGYLYNWQIFQTTAAKIIAASDETLSAAITARDLVLLDATVDIDNGDPGVEWEIQYENNATAANGRLWFVKGSPIRISLGNAYTTFTLFDAGSGGPLYSPAFNVNSADLIGETIYAAAQGISKDTRLIKGSSAQTTAAASAAAASDEQEEK
jgi:hypothetical protein